MTTSTATDPVVGLSSHNYRSRLHLVASKPRPMMNFMGIGGCRLQQLGKKSGGHGCFVPCLERIENTTHAAGMINHWSQEVGARVLPADVSPLKLRATNHNKLIQKIKHANGKGNPVEICRVSTPSTAPPGEDGPCQTSRGEVLLKELRKANCCLR